jgi:hypothetical protein
MEELLLKAGFKETEYDNEWSKGSWTIRIFRDEMETFNEPRINTPGVYFKCKTTIENLDIIIKDIEERIK